MKFYRQASDARSVDVDIVTNSYQESFCVYDDSLYYIGHIWLDAGVDFIPNNSLIKYHYADLQSFIVNNKHRCNDE